MSKEKLKPVSKANPCPVCGGDHKCSVGDRGLIICGRCSGEVDGFVYLRPSKDPQFNCYRKAGESESKHSSRRGKSTPPKRNWLAIVKRLADQFDAKARKALATRLGLPTAAFDLLPNIGADRDDINGACWTFPECDATGNCIGYVRRFLAIGKPKKAALGCDRGLTLATGWRDRPGAVYVVEGATDALAMALAGLSAVGRPGASSGTDLLVELFKDFPSDRQIVVMGENDPITSGKSAGKWPGKEGAELISTALANALGRSVYTAFPPDGAKDVRVWLTAAAKNSDWSTAGKQFVEKVEIREVKPPTRTQTIPQIILGVDEYRVNDEAVAAIATEPDLYQRAGSLVHVRYAEEEPEADAIIRRPVGTPVVREIPQPLLRSRLTKCANFVEIKVRGERVEKTPAHPPNWCVQDVHSRGEWAKVRRLEAVIAHPAILPDGNILCTNGYDRRSRLLVAVPADLAIRVHDHPTHTDVLAAVATVNDVLADFPFNSESHRAAWFAGLLTPLAWFAFDGPSPLFLIDANVRGAGKGLLGDVIALTVTGRRFPTMSYTNDREELRKKITTLAVEGERMVLLDNLAGAFGNDILDAALTSDHWKDRLLGGNRVYDGPLHLSWFATGNNVQIGADTSRRVCHIQMESPEEKPELKSSFRYGDLRTHVRENRGRLLSAALTILRGWYAAGKPRHGLSAWGSYEGWSGVVREAVVFAGLSDPGETRLAMQSSSDRDAGAVSALITCMEQLDPCGRGLTAAEMIDESKRKEPRKHQPSKAGRDSEDVDPRDLKLQSELKSAIEDLCGRLDGLALGHKLRHFARRNFAGKMIDRRGGGHGGVNRWVVVSAATLSERAKPFPPSQSSDGGDGGDGGDVSVQPKSGISGSGTIQSDGEKSEIVEGEL